VQHKNTPRGRLAEVLGQAALLRLNFGVFVLHAVQLAMWVAIPALLVQAGLPKEHHWWVYLPAVLASFIVMGTTLFPLEKRGYLRAVFLSAIGLIALVQLGLLWGVSSRRGAAVGPVICFFLRLQCAGGQPAQLGFQSGPRSRPWHGAGCVQHPAIAWIFYRRRTGWLADQKRRGAGPFHRVWRRSAALAGGCLAHASAVAKGGIIIQFRRNSWHQSIK
jgi:hypothetical protein